MLVSEFESTIESTYPKLLTWNFEWALKKEKKKKRKNEKKKGDIAQMFCWLRTEADFAFG